MANKSCFFMGHREADERLLPRLELEISRLIQEENVRYFYVGGYGDFDRLAAVAVKKAKVRYSDIILMRVFRTIRQNTPLIFRKGLTGVITQMDWKLYQSDMRLPVLTDSWWIPAIG